MIEVSKFYVDQHLVTSLSLFLTTIVTAFYFVTIKDKTLEARIFTMFMFSMAIFAGFSVMEASAIWVERIYFVFGQIFFILLAVIIFIQFAYRFPRIENTKELRLSRGREPKILLVIGILILIALAIFSWFRFSQIEPYGTASTDSEIFDISILLADIWIIVVFFRRSISLSKRNDPNRRTWLHFWKPGGQLAQAASNMAKTWIFAVALSILTVVSEVIGFEDPTLRFVAEDYIPTAGVLLFIFLLTIVYLNNSPETTSFMAKLTGISLVTTLMILSLVANIFVLNLGTVESFSSSTFFRRTIQFIPIDEQTYHITTDVLQDDSDLGEQIMKTGDEDVVVNLPFTFQLYEKEWGEMGIAEEGYVYFGEWSEKGLLYNVLPAIMLLNLEDLQATEIYYKGLRDSITVTWVYEPSSLVLDEPTVVQLVLSETGSIDLNYVNLSVATLGQVGIQSGNAGDTIVGFSIDNAYSGDDITADAIVTDDRISNRIHIHENISSLVWVVLSSSLMILIGFPYFFDNMLVEPLNLLVTGVQEVNKGDLSVSVEVRYRDEIGIVTGSFNGMVKSIQRMQSELNIAKDIQMSMLPLTFPPFPDRNEFEIFAELIPALEVGGDFYDFFFIDQDHLCFVVGDVSGKGVPGALFMAVTKTLIKSGATGNNSTASILKHANEELVKGNDASMFATVFICILNLESGELVHTNAGHNPPYIIKDDGELIRLDARHGPIVGPMSGMSYKEGKIILEKNDTLLLYTDGVTEAMNANKDLFTEKQLVALLNSSINLSVEALTKEVIVEVKKFEDGAVQADDITVLALKYMGSMK